MATTLLPLNTAEETSEQSFTTLESWLITRGTPTYNAYYNGKMSYKLHGKAWEKYVSEAFPDLLDMDTSENVFKAVIDLYAENIIPMPDELEGFSNSVVPLLCRGEVPVVVTPAGEAHFPEQFEMISDGRYTVAAIFTRSIEKMQDYITIVDSNGRSRLFSKPVPKDMAPADHSQGFTFVEEESGHTLFRFSLDDKGFGASMAALQDRVNHSIIDQTVVAEMYARPFWYLLNVEIQPENPYLPKVNQPDTGAMKEHKSDGTGARIFTTNSEGPFGQLEPPTISDMIAYHDSIIDKVSQASGIPQHYFKPGSGTPPTGVALKVLSKRFNNKIARMRDNLRPLMEELAALLGVEKTAKTADGEQEFELWNTSDDLLQESMDQHGISLSQMGYPLEYIASVVTPGVDLDDYVDDSMGEPVPDPTGGPVDMTAMGQTGLPATPGQVQAYAQNPGQRAKARG